MIRNNGDYQQDGEQHTEAGAHHREVPAGGQRIVDFYVCGNIQHDRSNRKDRAEYPDGDRPRFQRAANATRIDLHSATRYVNT